MTVPSRVWLNDYSRRWLRGDVVAGITLAAYLLPAAIGDASLAGLPPQTGIYSCVFAGLVFWIFCGSRQTAPTVTSAISMLIGASLPVVAGDDPSRLVALASTTALMVGLLSVLAYLLRLGTLVSFFSEIVLVGFKVGLALYLASTQLPKLFGVAGSHGDFWENVFHFASSLRDTHPASLALGAAALALLLAGKYVLPNRPIALMVVAAGIALAHVFHLDQRGVALLGYVPRGIPLPALPAVGRADVSAVLPLALASFLLAAVETSAIGRMFAAKHRHRLDATQEFLALGGANIAAGLGGGFAVSGGSSQSLVNEAAGAHTPLSGLVAALLTLCVALFLTDLLRNLPQPVLAAIVLAAITGLVDVDKLREIWHFSRQEFAVAMAALAGVLAAGLLDGVLIGVAISILLLIHRAARPRLTEVGRVPDTSHFADLTRHPENERIPGVLVMRPEGSLLFFNVEYVHDQLMAMVAMRGSLRRVVLLMSNVPFVDLAGADLLAGLSQRLKEREVELRLAETRGAVRDALRRLGGERLGLGVANQTVIEALG